MPEEWFWRCGLGKLWVRSIDSSTLETRLSASVPAILWHGLVVDRYWRAESGVVWRSDRTWVKKAQVTHLSRGDGLMRIVGVKIGWIRMGGTRRNVQGSRGLVALKTNVGRTIRRANHYLVLTRSLQPSIARAGDKNCASRK